MTISVIKRGEYGYEQALEGLSYNKNQSKDMEKVSLKLAPMDGGHNKFLESMFVWLSVTAPRYWWQEADTYRLSTKQSESTMHTIHKRFLVTEDFEDGNIWYPYLQYLNEELQKLMDKKTTVEDFKRKIPESFLQKRMWCMSYKTLRNVIFQRKKHKLSNWKSFIKQTLEQVDHPEILPKID